MTHTVNTMARAQQRNEGLPVIEIGHLFPNYHPPRIEADASREMNRQLNESALAEEAHDDEENEEGLSRKRTAEQANHDESTSKKKRKNGHQTLWEQRYEELNVGSTGFLADNLRS